jgi:hypothetical protein
MKLKQLYKEAEEQQQKSGKFIMVSRSYEYHNEFKALLNKIKDKVFSKPLNEADDDEEAARRAAEEDMKGDKEEKGKKDDPKKDEPKKEKSAEQKPKTNTPKPVATPKETGEQQISPEQGNESPAESPAGPEGSTQEPQKENPVIADPEKNIFSAEWKVMRLPHTTNKTTKSQFDIRYKVEGTGNIKSYIVFYSLEGLEKSGKENWDWKEEDLKAKFVGACPMPDAASYEAMHQQFVQFRWLFGKALDFIDKHEGQMRPQ